MSAERYKCDAYGTGKAMIPDAQGAWVLFTDYTTLQSRLAAAEQRVKELTNLHGQPQCWKVEHTDIEAREATLREVCHQAWRELSGLQMDGHPVSQVILDLVDKARDDGTTDQREG